MRSRNPICRVFVGTVGWLLAALGPVACGAPPGGFVVDEAGVIESGSESRLHQLSQALLDDAGIELVTMTVPALGGEEIATVALGRFESARVGADTRDGHGLLLLVAPAEERVRIEVSYSLEGVLPDIFIGYVEREQMVPYFADRLVGEGIEATVELVVGRLYEAVGRRFDALIDNAGDGAGGAGAEGAAPVGGGSDRRAADTPTRQALGPQPSPEAAWSAFLEIQRRHIKDPDLGLYDEASSALLHRRPNSNAAQDHLAALYSSARFEIRQRGEHAAVVFPDDRTYRQAPWFFRRGADGWQLDGSMYPDVIGYNHRNQWRFKRLDHPYVFAFEDHTIDGNGFARHRRTP